MPKHEVIRQALFNIQVCSEGTYDEALEFVRADSPAGTTGNWSKYEEGGEEWERMKPCQCGQDPNRKHYMFVC